MVSAYKVTANYRQHAGIHEFGLLGIELTNNEQKLILFSVF